MTEGITEITIEKTQTLDAMLHQVLNQALVAIGAEAGSLMLVDHKQGILQIKARLGKPRSRRKTEWVYKIVDRSIAGWVVRNKQSFLCLDVEDPQYEKIFAPSRSGRNFSSVLSVPIIYDDRVLAVINADAAEKNLFNDKHMEKLESIARQAAKPIAERISILDALAEFGVELTSLPREGGVERVLERIAQLAEHSLGADAVTLYQYIQEKDEFPVEGAGPTIAGTIKDPRPMRRKVYAGDVPWTVVKERKSGFYSDVHEQEFLTREVQRPGDTPRDRFVDREGIQSMAALLLPFRAAELKDEEVVGVMFVNYRTRHDFGIDERRALATFADYAAVAILNARHEERRRKEQRRADQIRMVESISANFAHRMSNLAGTSRVATQLIREHIDATNPLLLRQLDRIEHEATILLELAERLARPFKETGTLLELTPIDITKLLEEELEHVRSDIRRFTSHAIYDYSSAEILQHIRLDAKRITVMSEIAPRLPKVQSVEFQLRQVLRDIISNAIEAVSDKESGKLNIRTRLNKITNRVEVEVTDNGPGIPDDIRSRLFAPGTTTKKDKLGIGLWWCRAFMQATDGDVVLKNTSLGEGTTFVIEIPCAGEAADALAERHTTLEKSVDVLIVDDQPEWREQLKDALEQYSVETATTYAKAWHALVTSRFRLAVVDIRLGDPDPSNEDGLRLLADIGKAGLHTKVIIVSGYGTDHHRRIASQSPLLIGFINKREFDLAKFRSLVRQVVEPAESSQSDKMMFDG